MKLLTRFLFVAALAVASVLPTRAAISPEADALFTSLKAQVDALRTALASNTGSTIDPAVFDSMNAKIDAVKASLTSELGKINATLGSMSSLAAWNANQLPAVTDFSVKQGSSGSTLTLTWSYNAPEILFSGFRLERSENGMDWELINSPFAGSREWKLENVPTGKLYYYRLYPYALALARDGASSNVISFTGGTTP